MSEDLNQIYCRRSVDMNPNQPGYSQVVYKFKIVCHRSILANILKETGEFDEIIHL
jgi:hypothetical protein